MPGLGWGVGDTLTPNPAARERLSVPVPQPELVVLGVKEGEAVRERLSVPVPQPELVVLGVKEGEAVGVGLPEGHREEEGE